MIRRLSLFFVTALFLSLLHLFSSLIFSFLFSHFCFAVHLYTFPFPLNRFLSLPLSFFLPHFVLLRLFSRLQQKRANSQLACVPAISTDKPPIIRLVKAVFLFQACLLFFWAMPLLCWPFIFLSSSSPTMFFFHYFFLCLFFKDPLKWVLWLLAGMPFCLLASKTGCYWYNILFLTEWKTSLNLAIFIYLFIFKTYHYV